MIACAFVGKTHQRQFHKCQSDLGSPHTVESLTVPELQIVSAKSIVHCVVLFFLLPETKQQTKNIFDLIHLVLFFRMDPGAVILARVW